jgi:hypothetical protein
MQRGEFSRCFIYCQACPVRCSIWLYLFAGDVSIRAVQAVSGPASVGRFNGGSHVDTVSLILRLHSPPTSGQP